MPWWTPWNRQYTKVRTSDDLPSDEGPAQAQSADDMSQMNQQKQNVERRDSFHTKLEKVKNELRDTREEILEAGRELVEREIRLHALDDATSEKLTKTVAAFYNRAKPRNLQQCEAPEAQSNEPLLRAAAETKAASAECMVDSKLLRTKDAVKKFVSFILTLLGMFVIGIVVGVLIALFILLGPR
eukprot:Rmarinus@m.16753